MFPQVAELCAAIEAVRLSGDNDIEIRTDSTYTIKGMTEWRHAWKCSHWNKALVNKELWKELSDLVDARLPRKTTFVYVPAHSGVEGNEQSDLLAKTGAESDK